MRLQKAGAGQGIIRENEQLLVDRDFDYLLQVCTELLQREPMSSEQVGDRLVTVERQGRTVWVGQSPGFCLF